MSGIMGYIGTQNATPVILSGLRRLEYHGYDSAGICTLDSASVQIRHCSGKLVNLERLLQKEPIHGTIGIGHTRWTALRQPDANQAHPQQGGSVVVVQKGTIENSSDLRGELIDRHQITSHSDCLLVSHLIDTYRKESGSLEEAVRLALKRLRGRYALCILCDREQDTLIAARQGAPLAIGINGSEYFMASDISAILPHTQQVVLLNDGEMAVCKNGGVRYSTVGGETIAKEICHIAWSPVIPDKGSYAHFMLKEIFDQPHAVESTITASLDSEREKVVLPYANLNESQLSRFERVLLVASGSSWHAALVGKYLIEEYSRIPVEVDIASEFRYRDPLVSENTLVVPISQSGETADTLAALQVARSKGGFVLAISNVIESSLAREADGLIHTQAGPELGVASTKTFITQLVALHLLSLKLGCSRGTIDRCRLRQMLAELATLPQLLEEVLRLSARIDEMACEYLHAWDAICLGRGIHFPIALEGALKLKEITYIHAEGYPAGEMKHGPIALIDRDMPVVFLAPRDRHYPKVKSNLEEVIARGGRAIALCTQGDRELKGKTEHILELPLAGESLTPMLFAIPLQLLAYHLAVMSGKNVDRPRNLAKSVAVE